MGFYITKKSKKSRKGLKKSAKSSKRTVHGIGLSSKEESDFLLVKRLIHECDPSINVYHFDEFNYKPELLDEIDFLLTIGGDGSVAWLVGAFYKRFETIDGIKPIIPVVRAESVGYLKQLDLEPDLFKIGFKRILNGEYEITNRTVLKTHVAQDKNISVNEVMMTCTPHLGKFTITIDNGVKEVLAEIFADGVMIVTSIGSTAWAMAHGGLLNVDEDSLEIIFVGAMHGAANYIIPKKGKIYINVELKNPVITKETIFAYNQARKKRNLTPDPKSGETLGIVYSTQILVDGKVVSFGSNDVIIDPNCSIPFVSIKDHTVYEKARKLTKNTETIFKI